jgi:hypothetical protein
VRLFDLGNHTVVLDEVHAYDTYTSGLIEALLAWLRAQGSSVILMSATLPSERRRALLAAYGAADPVEAVPYPRVTAVADAKVHALAVPWERRQRVVLQAAPCDPAALAAVARAHAALGGCVLRVVNTVERAQRLYVALGEGEPVGYEGVTVGKRCGEVEVYLVHARFPGDERDVRERPLLAYFGRRGHHDGTRPQRALVIATQVVDQTLDVDFARLITDLAPVDLILHRVGRLHRFPHVARPPSCAEPVCPVAVGSFRPGGDALSGPSPFTGRSRIDCMERKREPNQLTLEGEKERGVLMLTAVAIIIGVGLLLHFVIANIIDGLVFRFIMACFSDDADKALLDALSSGNEKELIKAMMLKATMPNRGLRFFLNIVRPVILTLIIFGGGMVTVGFLQLTTLGAVLAGLWFFFLTQIACLSGRQHSLNEAGWAMVITTIIVIIAYVKFFK